MKALFNARCDRCETFKPRCATLAVRGTNAHGGREERILDVCEDCRKTMKGLYRVHPKYKGAKS